MFTAFQACRKRFFLCSFVLRLAFWKNNQFWLKLKAIVNIWSLFCIVASGSQLAPQPVFQGPLRQFSCALLFSNKSMRPFSCALLKKSTGEFCRARHRQTILKCIENYNRNIQVPSCLPWTPLLLAWITAKANQIGCFCNELASAKQKMSVLQSKPLLLPRKTI